MAFVDMTSWIPVDEAKAKISELISNGTFTKNQIKKSSNLFANRKDKTDGYICRVLIEEGVHPELEMPKKEKKQRTTQNKVVKVVNGSADTTSEPVADNRRWCVVAEPIEQNRGLFLINQGGKYWVEEQNMDGREKKIVSAIVETEQEASGLWRTMLARYKSQN